MDKRYNVLPVAEQLELRRQAVEDVLRHPDWSLAQAVRHLKRTMRLTTAEMAKLAGVGYRTLQDIEQERSDGTVQTMNRIFGMLGLKLAVGRVFEAVAHPLPDPVRGVNRSGVFLDIVQPDHSLGEALALLRNPGQEGLRLKRLRAGIDPLSVVYEVVDRPWLRVSRPASGSSDPAAGIEDIRRVLGDACELID